MKLPVLSTLTILSLAPIAFCQEPAANPPATTTTTSTDKPKPLSSSDKSFLKKSLDSLYFLTNLTEGGKRNSLKVEDTKKLAEKISNDSNKIYGELSALITDPKELPNKVGGGDKSKMDKAAKAEGDKYDKEQFELIAKELKSLARSFEAASKSAQNETIKQVITTWIEPVKTEADDAEKIVKAKPAK